MTRFTKIAVTVPTETFEAVEKARAKLGASRSAAVARALDQWVRGLDAAEADRRYAEAYLRQPEAIAEIEGVATQAVAGWSRWAPGEPLRAAEPRAPGKRRGRAAR